MKIWSYWNSKNKTKLINDCISTWDSNIIYKDEKNEIIILNDENLENYIDIKIFCNEFYNLTPTFKSDCIRLYLIYTYGGIWLDASIKINEKWKLPDYKEEDDYYAFYKNDFFSENFCIFSPLPNNKNIKKWLDLTIEISTYHPSYNDCYVYDVVKKTKGYNCTYIFSREDYFMTFFAYCYLSIQDKEFKQSINFKESFSFYPGFFGSPGLFSSPGILTKFTNGRRKIYENRYFLYLILILVFGLFIFSCYYWLSTMYYKME